MCKRFHFLSFSHMRCWFVFANRYYVQKNIYDVSGKIYFWHSHHMMLGSKGILTPLIPNCYVLCTPAILKTFVIRSFFFKKWLLTHVFGGSQVQKSSCKQACIGFMTFWPWYHHHIIFPIILQLPDIYKGRCWGKRKNKTEKAGESLLL